jgi:hypothetical protein
MAGERCIAAAGGLPATLPFLRNRPSLWAIRAAGNGEKTKGSHFPCRLPEAPLTPPNPIVLELDVCHDTPRRMAFILPCATVLASRADIAELPPNK